ncbi:MAG: hypothetical protein U9R37_01910 [Campylobacterota bacterium]|nr:hypothetical protein [Campylobacterota bacterium]
MAKFDKLLKQAHSYFTAEQYDKALFLYSQIVSQEPKNIEYQLYCILCDMGYDNSEKAQGLFDYFTISKDNNFDEAVEYIENFINAYDGDNEKMMNLLKDISDTNIDALNAIKYEDFMELVNTRGSFTEAYQDIMFSTKVAITTKDELVDFINNLIDNNFNSTAYSYLDGFNEYFSYDKEVTKLYEKLESKNIDS